MNKLFGDGSSNVTDVSYLRTKFFYTNLLNSTAFHAIDKWDENYMHQKIYLVKILIDRKSANFVLNYYMEF